MGKTPLRTQQIPSTDTYTQQPNYETWLNQIVAAYQTHADGKDRTFSRFLLDLPHVPQDILTLLRESCVEADRSVPLLCASQSIILTLVAGTC